MNAYNWHSRTLQTALDPWEGLRGLQSRMVWAHGGPCIILGPMTDLPAFSLDADWFHLSEQARLPADLAAGRPLPDLHRLPPERPLFLARLFSVPPIGEVCLRYLLHIGHCPADMALTVNRQHFDSLPPSPFELDITDHIWLEDNLLTLMLPGPGPLHGLRLLASPCEQF